jgi:hypothetical protein
VNVTQRKIIIPILRIFISLCSTPQFHWHLSKYNALDLLNLIREKDDDLISDIAKEVCEKVIDHSQEGNLNLFTRKGTENKADTRSNNLLTAGGLSPSLASISGTSEYNVKSGINDLCQEQNLTVQKNLVVNLEKMLIEKKVKLEKFENPEITQLLTFFAGVLKLHEDNMATATQEGLMNSQLRRIIIKSLLVTLNFIYTKKYLKDIIAGYMKQPKDSAKDLARPKGAASCVIEEPSSLRIFRDALFQVIEQSKKLNAQNYQETNQSQVVSNEPKQGNTSELMAAGVPT